MEASEALKQCISDKLSETLMADKSVDITNGSGEEKREIVYEGYTFRINRGHAYKDHRTGPATNPRFSGPDKAVEKAIMDDAIKRIEANQVPKVAGIGQPGTGVLVHGTPIRYNLIKIKGNTGGDVYMISDYMVWQGDPAALQRIA
jgi:hypothetical protein